MVTPAPDRLLSTARQIADDVLFARALEAAAAGCVPVEQLQCLADAGFYGVATVGDPRTIPELIEILAAGCMTTAFVFTQHLGASAAAWNATGPVHDRWAQRLASGAARGGALIRAIAIGVVQSSIAWPRYLAPPPG